jgi:hypothetical protein
VSDDGALRDAMTKVATTLKGANVPFALSGGYASWARGGPEPTHDVDFVILSDDVPHALRVLEGTGLRSCSRRRTGWSRSTMGTASST